MKNGVLILIDSLTPGGGESVATNIAIKLKESNCYRPVLCATRCGGPLERRLSENKVKYIVLGRRRVYEIHKFSTLREFIKEEHIAVIHAHKTGSNFWAGILARVYNIPAIVSHFHGHRSSWSSPAALRRVIGRLSHNVIVVSEFDRRTYIESGIPAEKIVTVYNGIDYRRYRSEANSVLKRSLGVTDNSYVIGISAALRPEKNHEMLLLAAKELLRERRDVCFLIIGDGERRRQLERFAADLGIWQNCIFVGFRADIPAVLSIIDVGVLSSTRESFPLALLEYMASAKPVVATNVGGVCEAVQDGVNGFLVQPGDYCDMSRKLSVLLEDRSLAERMGLNGSITVRESFSEQVMIRRIEEAYDKALERAQIAVTH